MKNSKGISIAALVCAIVGIVLTFFLGSLNPTTNLIYAIIEIALCILGIILGAKGMKMAAAEGQGKGMAVAGLVISIISMVSAVLTLTSIFFIFFIIIISISKIQINDIK